MIVYFIWFTEILVPPIVEEEEYELPDDIENDNNATGKYKTCFFDVKNVRMIWFL